MNKVCKSVLGVSVAAMMLATTLTPAFVRAWGDSNGGRPSYTLEQINNGVLGDTITFNSISNADFGDEKNFVGAKVAGATVDTWNADTIDVKPGETYTIRIFVHNNSPKGEEAIAKDVRAWFSLPTTASKSQTIIGYVNSSNANPVRYWDEVTLKSSEEVYLEYDKSTAKYINNVGTFELPDEIITSAGAQLGYTSMNGEIPGCYKYSGVVTINVKVHSAAAAKFSKQVRIKDSGEDFSESVNAKVGDKVEYQIEYANLLAEGVTDVMVRDQLPDNIIYEPDTTYLYNSDYINGVQLSDNNLTTIGINIGNYDYKGNARIRFTGKVVDKTLTCGTNPPLKNVASVTINQEKVYIDDAFVVVTKDGESCKEKPQDDPTPTPTPTPEDTPTDTPAAIVPTGPVAVVTGAVGAGSMVTALGYFIASRKKLM